MIRISEWKKATPRQIRISILWRMVLKTAFAVFWIALLFPFPINCLAFLVVLIGLGVVGLDRSAGKKKFERSRSLLPEGSSESYSKLVFLKVRDAEDIGVPGFFYFLRNRLCFEGVDFDFSITPGVGQVEVSRDDLKMRIESADATFTFSIQGGNPLKTDEFFQELEDWKNTPIVPDEEEILPPITPRTDTPSIETTAKTRLFGIIMAALVLLYLSSTTPRSQQPIDYLMTICFLFAINALWTIAELALQLRKHFTSS